MTPSAATPGRPAACADCLRGRSTPGRGPGVSGRCLRCCCQATTPRSRDGGATWPCAGPPPTGRIWSRGCRTLTGMTAGCSRRPGTITKAATSLRGRRGAEGPVRQLPEVTFRPAKAVLLRLAFRLAAKIWHTEVRCLYRHATGGTQDAPWHEPAAARCPHTTTTEESCHAYRDCRNRAGPDPV